MDIWRNLNLTYFYQPWFGSKFKLFFVVFSFKENRIHLVNVIIKTVTNMAFADLFQDLMGVCKADHPELMNHNGTQEETLLGDITEQCFTHLKYGEALENIKSAARVRTSGEHTPLFSIISIPFTDTLHTDIIIFPLFKTLLHTQDQLVEVQGKMKPLSLNMNHLAKQINQMKKETGDLCCRETELQEENITKEQKLSEMESKVKSKDQQVM